MTTALAFVGRRHSIAVDLTATVDSDGHASIDVSAPGIEFRLPLRTIIAELQRVGVVRRIGHNGSGAMIVLAVPAAAVDEATPQPVGPSVVTSPMR